MAQQDVQNILQGLALGQRAHETQIQNLLENARLKQSGDIAQNELIQRQAQLAQAHAEFSQDLELRRAQQNLAEQASKNMLQRSQYEMAQTAAQTGINPPGTTSQPAIAAGGSSVPNATPVNPQQATSNIINFPGGSSVTVPSPLGLAQQTASVARITGAPAEEAKIRESEAAQKAETQRQTTLENIRQAGELAKTHVMESAANQREAMSNASAQKIATMPYLPFGGTVTDPTEIYQRVKPDLDNLYAGNTTIQQLQKDYNEKGMQGTAGAVVSTFKASGGVSLNDQQLKFKQALAPIVQVIPQVANYIRALPVTTNKLGSTVAGIQNNGILNPDLEAKFDNIKLQLTTFAKTIGGDEGQRLQKALLEPAEAGLLPQKGDPTSANIIRYNNLIDTLDNLVDKKLGNVPVAQREAIKKDMGLGNLHYLSMQNAAPMSGGKLPPAPAAGSTQLSPQALDLLRKHGINQ